MESHQKGNKYSTLYALNPQPVHPKHLKPTRPCTLNPQPLNSQALALHTLCPGLYSMLKSPDSCLPPFTGPLELSI